MGGEDLKMKILISLWTADQLYFVICYFNFRTEDCQKALFRLESESEIERANH